MPVVILNGLILEVSKILYLPASTQVLCVLFVERYGLDDVAANTLVIWMKLAVLLALLPLSVLLDARAVGYHAVLLAGAATMLLAWALLAFRVAAPPAFMSVLAGLGFACIQAAAPPLLAMRLRAAVRGRILAFFVTIQTSGLFIVSLALGAMRDASPPPGQHSSASNSALFVVVAGSLAVLGMSVALAVLDRCKEPARVYDAGRAGALADKAA